jgi:hypothetical protein
LGQVYYRCWATNGGSNLFTTQDASSQGYNDPKSTPNYVTVYYPTTASYLWTPSFHLTANQSYDFSFFWVETDILVGKVTC